MDATIAQAIAAVGALILAQMTLIGGWMYWLMRDLRSEMRRDHQELLVLLSGHTHADGSPAVFHNLPGAAGANTSGD